MTEEERRRRRFSEEFRKAQVALYESGKMSITDICWLHHVKRDSVMRWVIRFGSKPRKEKIVVSVPSAKITGVVTLVVIPNISSGKVL